MEKEVKNCIYFTVDTAGYRPTVIVVQAFGTRLKFQQTHTKNNIYQLCLVLITSTRWICMVKLTRIMVKYDPPPPHCIVQTPFLLGSQ